MLLFMAVNKEGKREVKTNLSKHFRVILGSIYALHTEYNGLAEVNNIIILYPQATISVVNPFVCWDL